MTAKEFAEKYKGHKVRVNDSVKDRRVGKCGVVDQSYIGGLLIGVRTDEGGLFGLFYPYELDVVDEIDRTPLPLPG